MSGRPGRRCATWRSPRLSYEGHFQMVVFKMEGWGWRGRAGKAKAGWGFRLPGLGQSLCCRDRSPPERVLERVRTSVDLTFF